MTDIARHRWRASPHALVAVAAVVLGMLAALTGIGTAVEQMIEPARFAALEHASSGQTVVVELDAASAASIKRWPWPRENYAQVLDRLRIAGARSIAFDVEFSAASTPAGDAAFAAALRRADGLVALPTFGQQADAVEKRSLDALPIPALREHATLASVSVTPDSDGVVRVAPFGTITAATPRPSLAAYVAGRSGAADSYFPVDYSIRPASIPRLSFVAVRDGRFEPRSVKGRDVVIGATAIEMGDRYAAPIWGVIPGVIVQALAAETLRRGGGVAGGPWLPLMVAAGLAGLVLRVKRPAIAGLAAGGGLAIVVGGAVLLQGWALRHYPIAPALMLLGVAIAGRAAIEVKGRFDLSRVTDEATGLPNRRALLAAEGGHGPMMVVAIANYDKLVAVLGGESDRDVVLRLADRLRLVAAGERVYRIADRLLALVPPNDDEDMLAGLRPVMLHPIEVFGRRVDAMVAIGLASGTIGERLLVEATMAAEEAVEAGVFWRRAAADLASLERQVSLMGELDDALAGGAIEVHYQPKLAIAADRIASAEALVRWRHPARGFIGPDLFIPLAERTDRIGPLTLHIIERAMHDVATWRASGHDLTVAVNISAKLVAAPDFERAVRALVDRRIVEPSALVFEVTESATLADPLAAAAALGRFRELGIAISMDDYGTGQSTLTYLRQLPLSELKIDRSFVQHAHANRNDGIMVRSTIELAHELGLKVVAEGIEDRECLDFLRAAGCDMAQGYLISRPIDASAFATLLEGEGDRLAA